MKSVSTRHDLRHEKDLYVYVQGEDQVYIRSDDEYLPKAYFSVSEAIAILESNKNEVHRWCIKMGIQAHANKRKKLKITFKQLRQMAKMK